MERDSTGQPRMAPRFWLGMVQMAGAAFALALLVFSGVSFATIIAVSITTIISLTSVLLRLHSRRKNVH